MFCLDQDAAGEICWSEVIFPLLQHEPFFIVVTLSTLESLAGRWLGHNSIWLTEDGRFSTDYSVLAKFWHPVNWLSIKIFSRFLGLKKRGEKKRRRDKWINWEIALQFFFSLSRVHKEVNLSLKWFLLSDRPYQDQILITACLFVLWCFLLTFLFSALWCSTKVIGSVYFPFGITQEILNV